MGPYVSLWVFMGFYGSLWVFMFPYCFLCVPMGPYGSSCVFMCSCVSLCVLIGPYGSLWISGSVDRASVAQAVDLDSIFGRVKPKTIKIGIHSFPA